MGQNKSCLMSEDKPTGAPIASSRRALSRTTVSATSDSSSVVKASTAYDNGVGATKTWVSESTIDESCSEHDRHAGYNLVDLKGYKLRHNEHQTLLGCEIYAPGLGIGLIVAHVGETKYNIHYKVQMADGRNIVAAIRRCEVTETAEGSNLNPRIFVMQRLF